MDRRRIGALAVLIVALVVGSTGGAAPPVGAPAVRLLLDGQLGGELAAVAGDGELAYLGVGPRLAVLSTRDALRPELLGVSEPLPGVVVDVALDGDRAYVITGPTSEHDSEQAGFALQVVDISRPGQPRVLATWPVNGWATYVEGADGYVCVVAATNGEGGQATVLSVADDGEPQPIATFPVGWPLATTRIGHDAFIADREQPLSDRPSAYLRRVHLGPAPELRAVAQLNSNEVQRAALAATGGQVVAFVSYLGDDRVYRGRLDVYDVSDPRAVRVIGSLDALPADPSWLPALATAGPYAYLYATMRPNDVMTLDLSNPRAPSRRQNLPLAWEGDDRPVRLAATERRLFVVGAALRVLALDEPASPALGGAWSSLWLTEDVALDKDHAYAVDLAGGVTITDRYARGWLPERGRIAVYSGKPWQDTFRVALAPGRLYVAADVITGVHAFDTSNATAPVELWQLDLHPTSMAASGERLFIAGTLIHKVSDQLVRYNTGFEVIDVSGSVPQRSGRVATGEVHWAMATEGNTVFLTGDPTALWIIDATKVADPTVVGQWRGDGASFGVATMDGHVLLTQHRSADSSGDVPGGLSVIDVRDRRQPSRVGFLPLRWASAIAVDGSLAFVADRTTPYAVGGDIVAVDLNDPARPRELTRYPIAQLPRRLEAGDGRVWIPGGGGGLQVLRFAPAPGTSPTACCAVHLPIAVLGGH